MSFLIFPLITKHSLHIIINKLSFFSKKKIISMYNEIKFYKFLLG
jgi:hypothetical protein